VFDLLHYGHINFLRKSAEYGKLIVGLVDDESCKKYKGYYPIQTLEERMRVLEAIKYIWKLDVYSSEYDHRIGIGFRNAIRKHNPDVITHGDDWGNGKLLGEKKTILEEFKGRLIEIPYTENVSDSEIRRKIWESMR